MEVKPDEEKIVRQALRLYAAMLEAQQLPFDISGNDDAVVDIQRLIDRIEEIVSS